MYKKNAVDVLRGTKSDLKSARKDSHVAKSFGASMKAEKGAKNIATSVDDQKDILSDSLGKDYVIEDSIDFGDFVVSLVSSGKMSTDELVSALEDNKYVDKVEPNYEVKAEADYSLNDEYAGYQYYLGGDDSKNLGGDDVYSRGTLYDGNYGKSTLNVAALWESAGNKHSNKEIVVAVIDSGVEFFHEDLIDHMWENPGDIGLLGNCGYDFADNDEYPYDEFGHGTHCAGIIAAQADNGIGISGVAGTYADSCNIKIMAIRAMDENGASTSYSLLGGFKYVLSAAQEGVNVRMINNSYGASNWGYSDKGMFDEIFDELEAEGVLCFFAAGNDSMDIDYNIFAPSSSDNDNLVVVGSLNESGQMASYSNYGKTAVDIFAPGTNILSTVSYDVFIPGIYSEEKLEETTSAFGVFGYDGDESTNPSAAGTNVSGFAGVETYTMSYGDDSVKLVETDDVELSLYDGKSMNRYTDKSLGIDVVPGEGSEYSYVVFFPYEDGVEPGEYISMVFGMKDRMAGGNDLDMIGVDACELEVYDDGTYSIGNLLEYSFDNMTYDITRSAQISRQEQEYYYDENSVGSMYDTLLTDSDGSLGIGLNASDTGEINSRKGAALFIYCQDEGCGLYVDSVGVSSPDAWNFDMYDVYSGTSMATPAAVGAAALLCALYPESTRTSAELKSLLLSSAEKSDELSDLCSTGGRINLENIVEGRFAPVVESIVTDTEAGTITINGTNFGDSEGELSISKAADKASVSYGGIKSWSDERIVLNETYDGVGKTTITDNYIEFYIKNADTGLFTECAEYVVDGKSRFEKIAEYTSEVDYSDFTQYIWDMLGTDEYGKTVYCMTGEGSIVTVDPDTGDWEYLTYDTLDSAFFYSEKAEDAGLGDYEEYSTGYVYDDILFSVMVDDYIYLWDHLAIDDREFYVCGRLDTAEDYPEIEIVYVSKYKEKNGVVYYPENMLVHGSSMCAYNGKIYCVGGNDFDLYEWKSVPMDDVWVFDPATNKWSEGESLPEAMMYERLVVSGGRMYALLGDTVNDEIDEKTTQPQLDVYSFDGTSWKKYPTSLPNFIKPGRYSATGISETRAAAAACGDGIIVIGESTDGYGDTYLIDTSNENDISVSQTGLSYYSGLSSNEVKEAAAVTLDTPYGRSEGLLVFSVGSKSFNDLTQTVYNAVFEGENRLFETDPGEVPKPDIDEGDITEPGDIEADTAKRVESKAKLTKKKAALKQGGSCKIKVVKLHGQKVSFSVTKKTKKKGVSVSSKGKVKVRKNAKTGTYTVKVNVRKNAHYKAKTLKFKVKVKKA